MMHGECKWRKVEMPKFLLKWIDLKVGPWAGLGCFS